MHSLTARPVLLVPAAAYALLAGAFLFLQHSHLFPSLADFDRWSAGQILALPILFALLSRVRVGGIRIPAAVFGVAIACVAASVALSYSAPGAVLLARMDKDDFEIETHQLRERINTSVASAATPAVRSFYRSFDDDAQVRELFRSRPDLEAVLWGNEHWLNVSFPVPDHALIEEQSLGDQLYQISGLRMVEHIPIIGISYQGNGATADFLADLSAALSLLGESRGEPTEAVRSKAEAFLLSAGKVIGRWTSTAHRAYPWWLLGNLHLRAVFGEHGWQRAELRCALSAYQTARSFLHLSDNPELGAAICNNEALALYLKYRVSKKNHGLRAMVRKKLRAAASTLQMHNLFDAPLVAGHVARANLRALKNELGSQG